MKRLVYVLALFTFLTSCSKDEVNAEDYTSSFVGTWKTSDTHDDYKTSYVWNFNKLTSNTVKLTITSIQQYKAEKPVTTLQIIEPVRVPDYRTLDFTETNDGTKLIGTGVLTNDVLSVSFTAVGGDARYWELKKQ
jgi:hypothetical protein